MENQKTKSRWGVGIWALYGGFVVFILSLAAWASVQRFDLVEPNYYERGLAYQDRIDQSQQALKEGAAPALSYDSKTRALDLCFGSTDVVPETGHIHFYRTSDARMDFHLPIAITESGCQSIMDPRLVAGYWRVKCEWEREGDRRYWEGDVFVN